MTQSPDASARRSHHRRRLAGLAFGGLISLAAYEKYMSYYRGDDDDFTGSGAVATGVKQIAQGVGEALQNPAVSVSVGLLVLTLAFVYLTRQRQTA